MKPVVAAYSDDVRSAIRRVISILSGRGSVGSVVVYLRIIVITFKEKERERRGKYSWQEPVASTHVRTFWNERGYGIAGANRRFFCFSRVDPGR